MLWPPAPSTNEAFQFWKGLRRTFLKRKRSGRGGFRLDTEDLDFRLERLDRAAHTGDQSAAADARDHGGGVWSVFENFEAHRAVTGDEIVIVERMNECSVGPGYDRSSSAFQATS